jgi:predicted lysophospholipase L1 biosynthesis ABC-type transport system permease subunit
MWSVRVLLAGLAAGLLVLFAAVTATRDARVREFAVMRALAGVLASLAAMAVAWVLARYVFGFSWNASPWVPLAGGAAGALLARCSRVPPVGGVARGAETSGGADAAPGNRRVAVFSRTG